MRGKDLITRSKFRRYRITPAYAGKSSLYPALFLQRRDHPRLCGEKTFTKNTGIRKEGSPPPMRGKVTGYLNERMIDGITPAYAGKRGTGIL